MHTKRAPKDKKVKRAKDVLLLSILENCPYVYTIYIYVCMYTSYICCLCVMEHGKSISRQLYRYQYVELALSIRLHRYLILYLSMTAFLSIIMYEYI